MKVDLAVLAIGRVSILKAHLNPKIARIKGMPKAVIPIPLKMKK